MFLLEISNYQKGYKCYSPITKKFYNTIDVTFFDNNSYFPKTNIQGENYEEYQFWETMSSNPSNPYPNNSNKSKFAIYFWNSAFFYINLLSEENLSSISKNQPCISKILLSSAENLPSTAENPPFEENLSSISKSQSSTSEYRSSISPQLDNNDFRVYTRWKRSLQVITNVQPSIDHDPKPNTAPNENSQRISSKTEHAFTS